jgi:flagellar hook-associated protein 3 FlgL
MATNIVSNLALQIFSTTSLQNEQSNLAQLNEELASGHQFDNLTDYTPLQAENLVNLQDTVTQRQAYVTSMQTVSSRLSVYDSTLGDLETVAQQAGELASQNPNLDTNNTGPIQQQVLAYMNQAVDDLNQQVGNRYIYSGTRYTTEPVSLTSVLNNLNPSATLVTANTLPSYDTQQPGTSAAAWTQDSVNVDGGDNLTYGVTSTQPGFQQLVAGLQFMNAATQSGVSAATYQSDMSQAASLLNSALSNIQNYHAGVAAAENTITQETNTQNSDISSLQEQIGNIQNVDLTQVGTELNLLQTQLQASYSATATLTQNSILKYL